MYRLCLLILVVILTQAASAQIFDDDGQRSSRADLHQTKSRSSAPPLLYLTQPPLPNRCAAVAEWKKWKPSLCAGRTPAHSTCSGRSSFSRSRLDLKIYVICASQTQATTAMNYFINQGLPVDSMEFPIQATNSVWISRLRPVVGGGGRIHGIAASWIGSYNRPRPADDVIPEWIAGRLEHSVLWTESRLYRRQFHGGRMGPRLLQRTRVR